MSSPQSESSLQSRVCSAVTSDHCKRSSDNHHSGSSVHSLSTFFICTAVMKFMVCSKISSDSWSAVLSASISWNRKCVCSQILFIMCWLLLCKGRSTLPGLVKYKHGWESAISDVGFICTSYHGQVSDTGDWAEFLTQKHWCQAPFINLMNLVGSTYTYTQNPQRFQEIQGIYIIHPSGYHTWQ